MTAAEILERCEKDRTLFGATLDDLVAARQAATREIHRYVLDREIALVRKADRKAKVAPDNSIPKMGRFSHSGPRVPTRRELR